jgi:hypothetical protein
MRKRDPRRLLAKRRAAAARVRILEAPDEEHPSGAISSRQRAEVTLPRAELERMWSAEHLERLARTYWLYLQRISLGLLRVLYTPAAREVVAVSRPLVLLRFGAPEYDISSDRGTVTWRIDRGLLVAPAGRGKGYLRIAVERGPDPPEPGMAVAHVSSEVANFYPALAGRGWFARIGRLLYRATQYRIHVIVTHGFLRSLANLELYPSVVGALRSGDADRTEERTGSTGRTGSNGDRRSAERSSSDRRPLERGEAERN